MNLLEAGKMSQNNINGRKRIGRMISIIFFIALFIYFLTNSMATSIDGLVDLIKGMPIARTLTFEENDELDNNFMEICSNIEHVTEVYEYDTNSMNVVGLTENDRDVKISSYSKAYEKYIVEGAVPKENEILIPHYINISSNEEYDDASQYIGRTVTLVTTNYYDEKLVYTYKVSGTYDNIYALTGFETMFVPPKQSVKMAEDSYEGVEKYNAEMEANKPENTIVIYNEFVRKYAVVVDDYENISQVKATLKEKLGVSSRVVVDAGYNELQILFDNIQFVVSVLTVCLLIAVIIMLIITVESDIRGRKKEIAMYIVQGYVKLDLIKILGLEYAIRFTPMLVWSIVATFIVLFIENVFIDKFMGMEYQILNMSFDTNVLSVGFMILAIVLCAVIYNINEQINKIDLLKEIKSEG